MTLHLCSRIRKNSLGSCPIFHQGSQSRCDWSYFTSSTTTLQLAFFASAERRHVSTYFMNVLCELPGSKLSASVATWRFRNWKYERSFDSLKISPTQATRGCVPSILLNTVVPLRGLAIRKQIRGKSEFPDFLAADDPSRTFFSAFLPDRDPAA